jgi:NADH-ubiquinone oxidoreductase chain 5
MYLFIVFSPLLSTIIIGLTSHWIGKLGAKFIPPVGILFSLLFSIYAFYDVIFSYSPVVIRISPWITTELSTIYWGFLFDTLTCVILIVVTSISFCVHLYSTVYIGEDPHLPRFIAYLSFFTFFRLILVTAENFVQIFVGWEGVGLCSYLLINFWFTRLQANKSAVKAMVRNRIGDFGLSIAIFLIYSTFGSVDYSIVFSIVPIIVDVTVPFFIYNLNLLDFICFFIFVGAVGKSAQVGLHTWLPDAIEGPTPVSALIHAATRVTAGVFLICRCSSLFEYAPNLSFFVTVLGGITAFLAATTGLIQNDLKRVIAYSTCSQLGYIVFAAGLSGYTVSMFHLSNHAFFKALLFRGAGSVIHAIADEQDIRKIGGLINLLPLTYRTTMVGSLALMGFPFLTGFYSKDVILELAYGSFTIEGRFVHTLGSFVAFFTAYYSIRLVALVFIRPANGLRTNYEHAHESPMPMKFPLIILSFASLFVGYTSRDIIIGLGTNFWGNSLFIYPSKLYIIEIEWLSTSIKMIPLIFSFGGIGFAFFNYSIRGFNNNFNSLYFKQTKFIRILHRFLNRKWFFDKVYNECIAAPVLYIGYYHTYQNIDRGLIERFGPLGFVTLFYTSASLINSINLSYIHRRIFIFIVGLLFMLILTKYWVIRISIEIIISIFITIIYRFFIAF